MSSAPPGYDAPPRAARGTGRPRRLARPRLFGPVLWYDLVRTSRQGRAFLLRAAYLLVLLFVFLLLYAEWMGGADGPWGLLTGSMRIAREDEKRFASSVFELFFAVQLGAVFLLTPAFTAAAVADEREKGTLDHLLATDLTGREIVLGKMASRLCGLSYVILGGLPVLGFLQLLGGIDPNLALAAFGVTALTMLSLAGLGVLTSVWASRPRNAALTAYALTVLFFVVSLVIWRASPPGAALGSWAGAGNVYAAYYNAVVRPGAVSAATTLPVLRDYAAAHGLLALLFVVLAVKQLRDKAGRPRRAPAADDRPRPQVPVLPAARFRPRVGEDPVLWKELYAETGLTLPPPLRGLVVVLTALLLSAAGVVFLIGIIIRVATGHVADFACLWVRVVGTPIACLLLLAVAVRAATAFSLERDRQTLDGLLTTPLDDRAILAAKWLGSVLSVREAWGVVALVWLLGMMAGGVHLLSLALTAMAWFAHAAFATGLGLWFSLHCRTTLRATAWTLVSLLVVGSGKPLLWLAGWPLAALLRAAFDVHPAWAPDLAFYGLTPPAALASLTFPFGDWYTFGTDMRSASGTVGLAWAGACLYGLAAAALWAAVRRRFAAATGRIE